MRAGTQTGGQEHCHLKTNFHCHSSSFKSHPIPHCIPVPFSASLSSQIVLLPPRTISIASCQLALAELSTGHDLVTKRYPGPTWWQASASSCREVVIETQVSRYHEHHHTISKKPERHSVGWLLKLVLYPGFRTWSYWPLLILHTHPHLSFTTGSEPKVFSYSTKQKSKQSLQFACFRCETRRLV